MTVIIITAYILAISIISFLLLTWTLNIPINVSKYQIQQEPLLIITGYLLLIIAFCRQYKKLYDVIFHYQDFLVENGLNVKKYNQAKLLLIYTKNSIWFSSNDGRIFKLLLEVGLDTLKLNNYADKIYYALISIALFSREQSSLRSYTCREISKNNKSVRLVFAYLDLSSDKKTHYIPDSGAHHVSLTDLYNSAERRLNLRITELGEGVKREIAHLETLLSEGIWPSSLSTFLNVVYTPEAPSYSERKLLKIQKEMPWIQSALKEVFMHLSIPAIERYISSKKPNAYLLTFDNPSRGHIAPHINNLPASKSENFQWTNYTKNARIGLLPKGCDFFEFAEKVKIELIKDLKIEESPPIETELILHRLGLSGLDHYEVQIPGVTVRKAILKLQRVIAKSSDTLELLTILKYNQTVDQIINSLLECPIAYLVEFIDNDERMAFMRVSEQLEKEFIKSQDVKDKEELIKRIKKQPQPELTNINKATKYMMEVLDKQQHPWAYQRVEEIVRSYFSTLQSITLLQS